MRAADLARLVALATIWGLSFVFLRVLAPMLGAVWTAESRVLIAGLALAAWFRLTGFAPGWRRNARGFVVVGLLNSALPFALYGWAAQHLPAAVMAVINACTPLSGAVCAALWLGEPLTRARLGGIGCGIAGVAWLSLSRPAAGALPDPILRLELENITRNGNQSATLNPAQVGDTKYTLMQPLPFWGKRDLKRDVASARRANATAGA